MKKLVSWLPGCLFILAFVVPTCHGQYFRLLRAELSDNVNKFMLSHGLADHRDVYCDDAVTAWIRQAGYREGATGDRVYAVKRLYDYPIERVRRLMIRLLGDASMPVREAAIRGLGRIRIPSSVPVLIDALAYCRGRCRIAVRSSLKELTRQDFGNSKNTWMAWYRQHRREFR